MRGKIEVSTTKVTQCFNSFPGQCLCCWEKIQQNFIRRITRNDTFCVFQCHLTEEVETIRAKYAPSSRIMWKQGIARSLLAHNYLLVISDSVGVQREETADRGLQHLVLVTDVFSYDSK
jgi:hypothetical protein